MDTEAEYTHSLNLFKQRYERHEEEKKLDREYLWLQYRYKNKMDTEAEYAHSINLFKQRYARLYDDAKLSSFNDMYPSSFFTVTRRI